MYRMFRLRNGSSKSISLYRRNQGRLCISPGVSYARGMSEAADGLRNQDVPAQLLTAALPFIPDHGFSSSAILAGAACQPELQGLSISQRTLSGLFPSTITASLADDTLTHYQLHKEPIGPSKALAHRWIDHGNRHMKSIVRSENLSWQKDGIQAVKRAFEIRLAYNSTIPRNLLLKALALVTTPSDPFWGVRLPIEPPHMLPYGSHAFDVAAFALAGIKDYSKSREWMLRRIRLAGVYSAAELMSIADVQSSGPDLAQLERLLIRSESLATHLGNTFEFISYINRSRQAILKSLWLV